MSMERAALVVIDMQNGFVNEHSRHVVEQVVSLVERWEGTGRPIVFTRYLNYPNSPFERLLHWAKLQTPPQTEIVADLLPYAKRSLAILDKNIYSFFNADGTTLADKEGWTDMVFCGLATESCVLKSAVDAFERNITPWLVADASGSHGGQAAHEAGLLVAQRFIGRGQLVKMADLFLQME